MDEIKSFAQGRPQHTDNDEEEDEEDDEDDVDNDDEEKEEDDDTGNDFLSCISVWKLTQHWLEMTMATVR